MCGTVCVCMCVWQCLCMSVFVCGSVCVCVCWVGGMYVSACVVLYLCLLASFQWDPANAETKSPLPSHSPEQSKVPSFKSVE